MVDNVKTYRKRLNKWKNLGVWLVLISVAVCVSSVSMIRYNLKIDKKSRQDETLDKWVRVSLSFGGMNVLCQIIACLIMLSATLTMKKLQKKNGFNNE